MSDTELKPTDIPGFAIQLVPKGIKIAKLIQLIGRFTVFGHALRAIADGKVTIEEFDKIVDAAAADIKREARIRVERKRWYDDSGFDPHGFDRHGFDRDGYDKRGFDRNGYNKDGWNAAGYDHTGLNADGKRPAGHDFPPEETVVPGTRKAVSRYDKNGFGKDGFDRFGFDKDGFDRKGANRSGIGRDGRKVRE